MQNFLDNLNRQLRWPVFVICSVATVTLVTWGIVRVFDLEKRHKAAPVAPPPAVQPGGLKVQVSD